MSAAPMDPIHDAPAAKRAAMARVLAANVFGQVFADDQLDVADAELILLEAAGWAAGRVQGAASAEDRRALARAHGEYAKLMAERYLGLAAGSAATPAAAATPSEPSPQDVIPAHAGIHRPEPAE